MNQPLPRSEAWRRFTDPALLFIALAVLWEKSVDLFGIKRYLLPPLSQVLDSLWSNRIALLAQSWVTTQEVLAGFAHDVKAFPTTDRAVALAQIKDMSDLLVDPQAKANGLGYLREDRMRSTVQFVDKAFGLNGKVKPQDTYTNEMLTP